MKSVKLRLSGDVFLMHNNQAANPLNVYAKLMKPLTSKKNKTDEDYSLIARIEWEAGLYLHGGVVSTPARVLEGSFLNGAKKNKLGPKWKSGGNVVPDYHPLTYEGTPIKYDVNDTEIPLKDLNKYFPDEHVHQEMVRVSGQQVNRTRPIFYDWSLETEVEFDTSVLDERNVIQITESAGRLAGLGDRRPRLGKFEVEVLS